MKQPVKVLYSPIREPVWKWKGFGLNRTHFDEAEKVHFVCDWKLSSGEYMFPNVLEISSDKALEITEANLDWKERFPSLMLVPFDSVNHIGERKDYVVSRSGD